MSATVTTADKLSFTVFLAVAFHAALILGVTFQHLDPTSSTHTMEVTLAQYKSQKQPNKADYLAQFNQQGSGTLEKKALTTTPNEAQFQDTLIRETTPIKSMSSAPKVEATQKTIVTSTQASDRRVNPVTKQKTVKAKANGAQTLYQRSLEIASLEARLDQQRQTYARRPRIKRLTSLSTAASVDANYLNSWRRKIEKIGNLNYPAEARKKKLYGSLRLMVSILPNGQLLKIRLLESSGQPILDDAAMRIVKLSAPFAPFSDELRRTTDQIEIIRTWKFRKNSSLRSY